jgi:hypothetical protein
VQGLPGENNNDDAQVSTMKTRVDVLTTFPRPAKAANEDFAAVLTQEMTTPAWDAYEVWRTRIKAVQEQPVRDTRNG